MLTRRQAQVLVFITEFIRTKGYGPSYEEITEDAGLVSRSFGTRMVHQLAERGFVTYIPRLSRSVQIISQPPGRGVMNRAVFIPIIEDQDGRLMICASRAVPLDLERRA